MPHLQHCVCARSVANTPTHPSYIYSYPSHRKPQHKHTHNTLVTSLLPSRCYATRSDGTRKTKTRKRGRDKMAAVPVWGKKTEMSVCEDNDPAVSPQRHLLATPVHYSTKVAHTPTCGITWMKPLRCSRRHSIADVTAQCGWWSDHVHIVRCGVSGLSCCRPGAVSEDADGWERKWFYYEDPDLMSSWRSLKRTSEGVLELVLYDR